MPSRKRLHKYPPEYAKLFVQAYEAGLMKIDAKSRAAAEALRKDLYNYRIALWEDTVRPPTEENHALMSLAEELTFKIRDQFVFITIKESVYTSIVKTALEENTDGE